jgi:hypothetical protein
MKIFCFLAVILLSVCGGDRPAPADPSSSDWEYVDSITNQQGIWDLPNERPAEHRTRLGVRVYYNGVVPVEELNRIDAGISAMLARCNRPTNRWQPSDAFRNFKFFQTHSEFHVVLVASNYRSATPEILDCPLMRLSNGPTTCGTVAGLNIVNGRPAGKGGLYILVPKQDREKAACWQLEENCIANESEHLWTTNDPRLFFAYANDFDGNHPICRENE